MTTRTLLSPCDNAWSTLVRAARSCSSILISAPRLNHRSEGTRGSAPSNGTDRASRTSSGSLRLLSSSSCMRIRAYPRTSPANSPTATQVASAGERVALTSSAEDRRTISTGDSSPSTSLTSTPACRTTSSATTWAWCDEEALAETCTDTVSGVRAADTEEASSSGVTSSLRESTTRRATAAEVKTGTMASAFMLASCSAL